MNKHSNGEFRPKRHNPIPRHRAPVTRMTTEHEVLASNVEGNKAAARRMIEAMQRMSVALHEISTITYTPAPPPKGWGSRVAYRLRRLI